MRKAIIFSIALLCSIPAQANVLPFVDRDFKAFVNSHVPGPQRDLYAKYVDQLDQRMKSQDAKTRLKLREKIYKTALSALDAEHRAWKKEIVAFLEGVRYLDSSFNQERAELGDFLYWCGALEQFQGKVKTRVARVDKKDVQSSAKEFFGNVRTKLAEASSKVGNKVGSWFKSLRS